MRGWWDGLDLRERVLVAVAASLTLLVVVWQFILVPTLDARTDARITADRATSQLNRIQEAYITQRASDPALVASTRNSNVANGDALKAAITQSAQQKGIAIARLQGGRGEPIGVVVERVEPQLAFFWLEEVETRLGGTITRLTLEQTGGQTVRLSADIVGTGG